MENEIKIIERPDELIRQATDIAGICKNIVLQTAQNIQGKQYVRVEGWQAIATAHGCALSARAVEKIEGGHRAMADVIRGRDGVVIASAEGFVGDDEPMWAKRPEYARRAMAQTRAMSRAARSAFAHVVVMMNAGLSTTPAEEVPTDGFDEKHEPKIPTVEFGTLATKDEVEQFFANRKGFIAEYGAELIKMAQGYVFAEVGTYEKTKKK